MATDLPPPLNVALAQSPETLGRLLEACRSYLLKVAGAEMESRLLAKAGASDLVQEVFLEAHRAIERFHGATPEALLGWLRGILLNKVAEFHRAHQHTQKRAITREVAPAADLGIPAPGATPSGEVAACEQQERIQAALARLPPDDRQIIVWREWDGLPFAEIGQRLGKSADAARMQWGRAVERLGAELGDAE
jgi:RNA polymerase sigma-70 factor (ECF subfamily)